MVGRGCGGGGGGFAAWLLRGVGACGCGFSEVDLRGLLWSRYGLPMPGCFWRVVCASFGLLWGVQSVLDEVESVGVFERDCCLEVAPGCRSRSEVWAPGRSVSRVALKGALGCHLGEQGSCGSCYVGELRTGKILLRAVMNVGPVPPLVSICAFSSLTLVEIPVSVMVVRVTGWLRSGI